MHVLFALLAVLWTGTAAAGPAADAYRGADPVLLKQVREGFKRAPDSAPATRALIAVLDSDLPAGATTWPPVLQAYRAALEGLAGKHSHIPWVKYRHAKDGLGRFAGLVEAHPDSIEIRMLRYTTGSGLPDFFGMRPQAEADLAALVEMFAQGTDSMVPATQRRGYIQWILDHGRPAPDLRGRLEKLLEP